jgi:hypothetical protein
MPAHILVYCQQSAANVTAQALLAGLHDADLMTLAEGYGITDEEAVVKAAESYLRVEPGDAKTFTFFQLHYQAPERRQIQIERIASPAQIKEWVSDELEDLQDVQEKEESKIRRHLAQVKEIIYIELGWAQLENLGIVLSCEVAKHIAQVANGYIKDENGVWWQVESGICKRIWP